MELKKERTASLLVFPRTMLFLMGILLFLPLVSAWDIEDFSAFGYGVEGNR